MSDQRIRDLERKASQGDVSAQVALRRERQRTGAGKPDRLSVSGPWAKAILKAIGSSKPEIVCIRRSEPLTARSYWDGGSKDTWGTFRWLEGEYRSVAAPGAYPYDTRPDAILTPGSGIAIVQDVVFQSRTLRPRIYVHPDDWHRVPWEPTEPLSVHERAILEHTRSLKGGRYRREAIAASVPDETAREVAYAALIQRGLLRKNRSITPKGRNALNG